MTVYEYITTSHVATFSAILGFATILAAFYYRKKPTNVFEVPRKWKKVGNVKTIIMYPLKSGRRMPIDRAVCTEVGLKMPESGSVYQLRDRNFVIYKESNLTYENNPKILQIQVTATNNNAIIFKAPGMEDFNLTEIENLYQSKSENITLLYKEKIPARDCGDEASKWVSKYILGTETGLRLGFNDNACRRNIETPLKDYLEVYPRLRNDASGLYSNVSSYMLLTQASVDDISGKVVDKNITVNNFRPNIVVDGTKPFAEENWKWVKIGDVILYMVKYCVRCSLVTVDPESSARNKNYEPLHTMKLYRQLKKLKNIDHEGDKCVMGINMAMYNAGEIYVGDTVYASE